MTCSPRPTAEIAEAEESIETYRQAEADGVGAIGRDGKLVDAAHMRLAANVLHKAELVESERGTVLSEEVSVRRCRPTGWSSGPPATSASRSLRAVIEHPQLELVGVHVNSAGESGS